MRHRDMQVMYVSPSSWIPATAPYLAASSPWDVAGAPIVISAYEPLTSYAALQPTSWVPSPAPAQQLAASDVGLLDAIADVLGLGPAAAPAPTPRVAAATAMAVGDAQTAARTLAPARTARRTAARRAGVALAPRSTTVPRRANPMQAHVTQVNSRFNRAAPAGNRDCGPASVVMALRLLGLRLDGSKGGSPQALIDRARQLARPGSARSESTTDSDLERALRASGATTSETTDFDQIVAAAKAGTPVILNGNPSAPGAYGKRFAASSLVPFNGAHWIVVSGVDASGRLIINDPMSKVGALKVSPAELRAYMGASMGIIVDRERGEQAA